jgi:hypothetical protein
MPSGFKSKVIGDLEFNVLANFVPVAFIDGVTVLERVHAASPNSVFKYFEVWTVDDARSLSLWVSL